MEQIDELIVGGYRIYQQGNLFRFGMDAVLLYSIIPPQAGITVDLCSGNGAVALLALAGGKSERVTALELQSRGCDLCRKSARLNGCEDRLNVVEGDIRHISEILSAECADTVTVNPPYFKRGCGLLPAENAIAIARHEVECTIDDVLEAARYLLKDGGIFCMVHRTDRQKEICSKIQKYDLYSTEITTVHSLPGKPGELFLLRACKGEKNAECKQNTFTLMNQDHTLSDAYKSIYGGAK